MDSAISTHAPLARCDAESLGVNLLNSISTHAPLARCDSGPNDYEQTYENFNSRTSCEVRRNCSCPTCTFTGFQLTHLLRGATGVGCGWLPPGHFNSRTSCEVRPCCWAQLCTEGDFNSRTSYEVRPSRQLPKAIQRFDFNSRTSYEVRPQYIVVLSYRRHIISLEVDRLTRL